MNDSLQPKSPTLKYKIIIGIMGVIIVILAWQLIATKTRVNTFIIEKEKAISERQVMQHELDSLLREHEKIKNEYGMLTNDLAKKDSLIQAQAEEIQKLIESNAGRRQIQRKLDYLRGITQDYVAQIDKLLKENENLKSEIRGIQDNLKSEQEKSQTLAKDKENLKEQLNSAAVLSAYSISATGIRYKQGGKKEEIVDRAKKVEKIKITFTLGKNPLVEQGLKTVYVRIARPDNAILNDGSSFDFEGKQIMYSLKETVYYKGSPMNVTLYYQGSDRIVAGNYNIAIFSDGKEIGQTQLTLK